MKTESSNDSVSWKTDAGEDGTLFRMWRFFSNISDSLLLKVAINKEFGQDVGEIRDKLSIDVTRLRSLLLKKISNPRVLYYALRYKNDLPKDESGYVEGNESYEQEYDGLGAKEPRYLKDTDAAALLLGLKELGVLEKEYVSKNVEDDVAKLLKKYHLSYRYFRRVESIVLYNDFPPVPALWDMDYRDFVGDDLTKEDRKKLEPLLKNMDKEFKATLDTEVYRTPVTYFDKDKKCVVVEIYPDTSLELFKSKNYKSKLLEFQKLLLGYRYTDISYDGYADALYYYFTTYKHMSQKEALSKMKKIYGRKYVKGFDSEVTARASTRKRRFEKYAKDISE